MMGQNMMNQNMMGQNMMNLNIMNNNQFMMNNNDNNEINSLNKEGSIQFPKDKIIIDNTDNLFISVLNQINIRKKQFENKNQNGITIFINFYDNVLDLGLDLRLYVRKLIDYIFDEIFGELVQKIIWERQDKNQTTEDIIQNPIIEYKRSRKNDYSDVLFLEYKGKNLNELMNKTCKDIGLKNGETIFLKKKQFEIEVEFFASTGLKVIMQTYYDELIFNLIKRYMRKIGLYESLIGTSVIFLFNADMIQNSQKTVGELSIKNGYTITVIDNNNVIGAGGPAIDFVDVSSKIVKKLEFSKDAPKWREVCKGLNIFGICSNKNCIAKGKEVIYKTKLKEEGLNFCLNNEIVNIKCPICNKIINPKTCGFWKCEYQFIGTKIEDGEEKEYDSKTKETKGDEFEYFNPYENGKVRWTSLNIFVLPKQRIKYKSINN